MTQPVQECPECGTTTVHTDDCPVRTPRCLLTRPHPPHKYMDKRTTRPCPGWPEITEGPIESPMVIHVTKALVMQDLRMGQQTDNPEMPSDRTIKWSFWKDFARVAVRAVEELQYPRRWAETIDTEDGGQTVRIPGYAMDGSEGAGVTVDRANAIVLAYSLLDVANETPEEQAQASLFLAAGPHRCPFCSTETVYRGFSGGKEWYCPGCETSDSYESGQAPRRAVMLTSVEGRTALRAEMRAKLALEWCGAEPPGGMGGEWTAEDGKQGQWGDCDCTKPVGHEGDHACEPCSERYGAPSWPQFVEIAFDPDDPTMFGRPQKRFEGDEHDHPWCEWGDVYHGGLFQWRGCLGCDALEYRADLRPLMEEDQQAYIERLHRGGE